MDASKQLSKTMLLEEEIQKNWPSAVEGEMEHPELGLIQYWTGEQRGRVVLRFRYEGQIAEESEKMFFVDLSNDGWILRHISSFQSMETGLKLIKNQSFRELDNLEQKYRSVIDLFMESRKSRSTF